MKKQVLVLILALGLTLSLCGCAGQARAQRPALRETDRQTIEWLRSLRNS